jgi:hypothetical protein
MAGSLIKIDEEIVTSAVASVSLLGIDSTYDVYMVKLNNFSSVTTGATPRVRVTKNSSADTTGNYDYAAKQLRTDTTFGNNSNTNLTSWDILNALSSATGNIANGILYLFNFNNATEYSFVTMEITQRSNEGLHRGKQGGAVHTVASASDGIEFSMSSGNIASGTFTLYGLKK